MKHALKAFLLSGFFGLALFSAHAELKTVVLPASSVSAVTNVLATNQVMEILSTAMNPSSVVEITIDNETLNFGQGELAIPYPFVIAGPATVVFRKTSTGGYGSMFTFRTVEQQPSGANGNR